MADKPTIAFFEFTSCEGCQLTVINLDEKIVDIVGAVDIVAFREAMTEAADEYDIAFVEGCITRESEIPRLKRIRERAKILVALGACATDGCVHAIKNRMPPDRALRIVYGDKADWFDTIETHGIDHYVKVDHYCWGCPIDPDEFVEICTSILLGRQPRIPTYPVCVECKLKENVCLLDVGKNCIGPITRAGCGAICPTYGNSCEGCRSLVPEPGVNAQMDVLKNHGLTLDDALKMMELFCADVPAVKELRHE